MNIDIIRQPGEQLGIIIDDLINENMRCNKIIFVSAFVALRTILRFREKLLAQKEQGAEIIFNIGFDLFGTSKNVFDELLQWGCNVFVSHNALPRVTFHPKIYCIESENTAQVIIGSNNLTDGGMYTNYETSSIITFNLPEELGLYNQYLSKINYLICPIESGTTKQLSVELIQQLFDAGIILNENESRKRSEKHKKEMNEAVNRHAHNPFDATPVTFPPLLPKEIRSNEADARNIAEENEITATTEPIPVGMLVWKKILPNSDALVVSSSANPVGGVRLTQANFHVNGVLINQTQYFRLLFNNYIWEQRGRYQNQEHTFVPMRVRIRNTDYGIIRFEISHKPSGEAGQGNYTTMLHWGRSFSSVIREANITGCELCIYETPSSAFDFFLDIQ